MLGISNAEFGGEFTEPRLPFLFLLGGHVRPLGLRFFQIGIAPRDTRGLFRFVFFRFLLCLAGSDFFERFERCKRDATRARSFSNHVVARVTPRGTLEVIYLALA